MSLGKILFVIGSLDLGGTERHLALITPRLKQLGWDPVIYCITHRGTQCAEVERSGVRVIGPPIEFGSGRGVFGKFFCLFLSSLRLFGLLLSIRPKIAHFFLPLSYLIGAPLAIIARIPVLMASRRSLNVYQRQHPLLARFEVRLHRHMDAIFGNSHAVVDE